MKKILYILALFLGSFITAEAQTGELQGKVVDEKGEPVSFAQVVIVSDLEGKKLTSKGARADINGRYTIKGINPGKVNVMAKYVGKPQVVEIDVIIYAGRPTTLDFKLEQAKNVVGKDKIVISSKRVYKQEIVNVFTPKETTLNAGDIKSAAVRNVNDLAGSVGGLVQSDIGGDLNIGGNRSDGTLYIIDGIKQTGSSSLPPSAIGQLEIITSGVPAKYGDFTGGAIVMTTKGPPEKLQGSIEGLTSQYLDAFGYNLLGATLGGPLIRKKSYYDTLSPMVNGKYSKEKGKVALGFFFSGEYQYDKDRFPSYLGSWKIKDAAFNNFRKDPYLLSTDKLSVLSRQELFTANDYERIAAHQNTSGEQIRLNGKFDWKLSEKKGVNLTFGGRYVSDVYRDFLNRYALLNYENNPEKNNKSYGGYARLYMPLSNPNADTGRVRGAYFQLQLDYEKSTEDYYLPNNGYNAMNYGYVGSFKERQIYNLSQVTGTDTLAVYYAPGRYNVFQDANVVKGYAANGVDFIEGSINPNAAYLTTKFLELTRGMDFAKSISNMDAAGALVNGKRVDQNLHNLFFPYARTYNGIQKFDRNQFRATGFVNFDLVNKKSKELNKHTIEIGFEVEQRINSKYNISPIGLWQTANSSANQHLAVNEAQNYNPLLVMNNGTVRMRYQDYLNQRPDTAIAFGVLDTIIYDNEVSTGNATNFAKNLREGLGGLDTNKRIYVHELNPNQIKLNMFSADELLASNTGVDYYGFNPYGEMGPMDASFESFFKDKDSKGNYKRNVAPFKPFYAAGYVQDRFQLKDIAFNIGFRLDYFNANQYKLIDPYVINGARTVSEVNNLGTHPASIDKNAVVYVNDINNPTKIIGYRSGSTWYDSKGNELQNANLIITESGGSIKPYLKGNTQAEREERDIRSANFNPNTIFEKTSAIINFMPRVNFSFKVDSNSMFFAHYDVLTQRPDQSLLITSALSYWELFNTRNNSSINNPNLKTPRTTDIEFGFKQKLSNKSSLTINFTYKELKDQLQITQLQGAYPFNYLTYANSDFATVKGAGIAYELRRTKNLNIRANYTMQFAEGTGSTSTSQLNLINAGQGNLKVIAPLSYDVRHQLNLIMDYRFASGVNYDGPQKLKKILQNFGVNLAGNLRSGQPYTQQANVTPVAYLSTAERAINLGDINSASKPWQYNFNLKVDKDFTFKVGKRAGDSTKPDSRKEVSFNVYLQIQNLFNTEKVLDVYRYTGSAETDGYLSSPLAQLDYTSKESILKGYGDSFRDLYKIGLEIPNNDGLTSYFARPRVIQLGAILNF
jgi:hypothetical protein